MKIKKSYKIFISSPSDVKDERDCVVNVCSYVGKVLENKNIVLEPVMWERHLVPEIGHPQQNIETQLMPDVDMCVAILKHTLGTKVSNGQTGTESEIKYFLSQEKVMLYVFSGSAENDGNKGCAEVTRFLDEIRDKLTYYRYENVREFEFMIFYHLIKKFEKNENILEGEKVNAFIQFNPHDALINRSENIVSVTDNGTLDYTITFSDEIDPARLMITGFPEQAKYKINECFSGNSVVRIKFLEPCPKLINIKYIA